MRSARLLSGDFALEQCDMGLHTTLTFSDSRVFAQTRVALSDASLSEYRAFRHS